MPTDPNWYFYKYLLYLNYLKSIPIINSANDCFKKESWLNRKRVKFR